MLSCHYDPGVYLGYAPGNTRKTLRLSCVEKKTAVEFCPSVDGVLNLKPGELEEKPGGGIPKVSWLLFGILFGKLSQFRPEQSVSFFLYSVQLYSI